MGGCAMIGQTMINVKASGARTRISTELPAQIRMTLDVSETLGFPRVYGKPGGSLVAIVSGLFGVVRTDSGE
jgi:hypothetical protein